MAKKKRASKKAKRDVAKKPQIKAQVISKSKSKLALRDLIFFAVLSLISFILYSVSKNTWYTNLFGTLGIVFLFIAIAFLIIWLALFFAKDKNKK